MALHFSLLPVFNLALRAQPYFQISASECLLNRYLNSVDAFSNHRQKKPPQIPGQRPDDSSVISWKSSLPSMQTQICASRTPPYCALAFLARVGRAIPGSQSIQDQRMRIGLILAYISWDTSLCPCTGESFNPTTEEHTWIRYFGGMIRYLSHESLSEQG
ncbi:hypothetical protein BKA82DRAFT_3416772 [Pisolithus tinctorius]|nr:hypothetical protein BKA82DRAFT_3416772 [Pisolithus tinctorius]